MLQHSGHPIAARQAPACRRARHAAAGLPAVLCASLFITTPAVANHHLLADYFEMSIEELMHVDVSTSASLLPTRREEAPGTVYAFDREDFARLGVRRLEQLFRFVPGFQLNQYRKRHTSVWARGLVSRNNNKMILLVDGIPRKQVYYGHFNLDDSLPLDLVDKVEIVLGPASSLYGANALGGVISVTTRNFSQESEGALTLGMADNEGYMANFEGRNADAQIFVSHLSQDAPFSDDRRAFTGDTASQPLDESYTSVYFKTRLSDDWRFSLDLNRAKNPFLFIPPTQDAWIEDRSLTAALQYTDGNMSNGLWQANIFYRGDRSEEWEIPAVSDSQGYYEHQHADLFGADLRYSYALSAHHALLVGGQWRQERGVDLSYRRSYHYRDGFLTVPETGYLVRNPDFVEDDHALFVQDVWDITDRTTLTLGARHDEYDAFGGHFNYRAALVHAPDAHHSWKLLHGTAIRTPNLREYMKVLEGTNFVAPVPAPEKIVSTELGYYRDFTSGNFSATLFHNELDDFIREIPTPDGADEYFVNSDGQWHVDGAELLLTGSPAARIEARFGASYIRSAWDCEGSPPYIGQYSFSLALDYRVRASHHLGVTLNYTDERRDTNAYATDTPDEALRVNLHARGALSPDISYQVGIDNLFDERIYDPAADFGALYNTEESRREAWARVSWNFH